MNNEKVSQSEKILLAAYELIATKGYAEVSVRDIANRAEVTLSQVNYYYKNKEGLFIEVVKVMSAKYLQEVQFILNQEKKRKEKLQLLSEYFKNLLINNPELLKIFYDLSSMSIWSNNFSKLLSDLFKSLAELINKNIVKDGSNELLYKNYSTIGVSRMILGTLIGTVLQFMVEPDLEELNKSLESIELIFA